MIELLIRELYTGNNINVFLLEALTGQDLERSVPNGGRSVGQIFRHMVEVRNQWLAAINPAVAREKLPKNADIPGLIEAFKSSASAVASVVLKLGSPDTKVKGFRSDATGFVMYLCSHDAHHRGQILLTLRLAGHRLDPKLSYALWDWPARAVS